jgi:long-chain acyl-CoA synthetase
MNKSFTTIGKLLLHQTKKYRNSKAIGWIENDEVKSYTFSEYETVIESLSLGLISLGLHHGDKVSILGNTCKEWHLLDISILCSRAISIPIYHTYTPNEILHIYNHSESSAICIQNNKLFESFVESISDAKDLKFIITFEEISESLLAKVPKGIHTIRYKDLLTLGAEEAKSNPDTFHNNINTQSSEQVATIIYTSGTTGEPKGAVITQGAYTKMLENINFFIKGAFSEKDKTLTFLPLSHVIGRVDSYLPLVFGLQTVYAESIEKVIENIALVRPTLMLAVPRIFEKIYSKITDKIEKENFIKKGLFKWANSVTNKYYEKIDKDLTPTVKDLIEFKLAYKLIFSKIYEKFGGRFKFFISGGAPLAKEIILFLRNANLSILEGYGLTETIAPCCLNPVSRQIPGSVGRPIGDVEIKFADDQEILIKSKAMFFEYYKNPEATAESFEDGWFKSGDIGLFNDNGYLQITDRKKDIIITSGGKNVAPQKIENMMKVQRHISNFVVIGDKRKYLTALVSIEKESFIDDLKDLGINIDCKLDQISNNPKVRGLIRGEIEQVNNVLTRFETIKKFHIVPCELTTDNYLTPSLKVKKKVMLKDFSDEIDAMYK